MNDLDIPTLVKLAPWMAPPLLVAGIFVLLWVRIINPALIASRIFRLEMNHGERAVAVAQAQGAERIKEAIQIAESMQSSAQQYLVRHEELLKRQERVLDVYDSQTPPFEVRPKGKTG